MSILFGDVASTLAVTDADPEPQSLQALKQRLRKVWTSISPSTLQHLIGSNFDHRARWQSQLNSTSLSDTHNWHVNCQHSSYFINFYFCHKCVVMHWKFHCIVLYCDVLPEWRINFIIIRDGKIEKLSISICLRQNRVNWRNYCSKQCVRHGILVIVR